MIDWKRVCLWGALLGAAAPATTQAAEAPTDARSSAPLATVTTDDSVEIRVQGLMPDGDEVEWKWGKLVVPVESKPAAAFAESYTDATVKRVALVGGEKPRLIVMFRHGSRTAKKLTEASTITHTGDGFRVVIPRRHVLAPPAPEPAAVPTPVAEPTVAKAPAVAAPTAEPVPAAPEAAEKAPIAAAAVEVVEAAPEAEPLNLPEPGSDVGSSSIGPSNKSMYGTLGFTFVLLAIGGVFVYWKRRNGTTPGAPRGFTVMGNQVLGPKSRIVLMGLGNRRMLLAVSEAGTTVVDKWSEDSDYVPSTSVHAEGGLDESSLAAIEFGMPVDPPTPRRKAKRDTLRAYEPPAPDIAEDENAESTAVNGLRKLREQIESGQEEADEDDAWSQALANGIRRSA
ncbi:MAG: flagellar biosynthetic protein FliO [Nannocystales bacterium]